MARKISESGRQALRVLEAPGGRPVLKAYRDGGGVPTIGFGHTRGVQMGQTCTVEQAENWLSIDLRVFELAVDSLVKVPLNDNQFDALVIFAFNVGVAAFERSTLLRLLNAGNYVAVPEQLMRWVKDQKMVKGKRVTVTIEGLVNRRAAEIALWCKPVPAPAPEPVEPGMAEALPLAPAEKPPAPVPPPQTEKVLATSTGKAQAGALAAGGAAAAIETAKAVKEAGSWGDTLKGIIGQVQPLVSSADMLQGVLVACTLGLIGWTLWDRRRKLKEGR